jgi:hypothetical protein
MSPTTKKALVALAVVLVLAAGAASRTVVWASAGTPQVLPYTGPVGVNGPDVKRGQHLLGVSFHGLQLPWKPNVKPPRGLSIRIRCKGCHGRLLHTGRAFAPTRIHGETIPVRATLFIAVTKVGWIGLWIRLEQAGSASGREYRLCLEPGHKHPSPCPEPTTTPLRALIVPPSTVETPPIVPPAPVAPATVPPAPPADREAITSIDGTRGDRAPYSGEFTIADQPFTALVNHVTYLGATIGNPNVSTGTDPGDTLTLQLCEAADCSGGMLASGSAAVNNYGMTTVAVEADVIVGHTYYLVWSPPEDSHSSHWLAFWHSGGPFIAASHEMEAVVRGYQQPEAGPAPGSRSAVDYAGGQPPPAPYSGAFLYGDQPFKAASDTITTLGVVVGNPALARGTIGPETIALRLCSSADCSTGVLATATPYIVNYGVTEADIGDIDVVPGETYFVYWQTPKRVEGQSWLSFWQGQGPHIEESRLLEAFARGYDRTGRTGPTFYSEETGYLGAPTFENPGSATGEGPRIPALSFVEISCKIYAPQIETAEPDGYWYLVQSPPYNDHYYAVANTFWNGVTPGESAEPINTDPTVPNCE